MYRKALVVAADEYHRELQEEVFEHVRGNYDHRWDVPLFNSSLRTLEKEGYTFTPVEEET